MSLLQTFAIFLVLVALPVEAVLACCYPPQMQGAKFIIERGLTRYFAADYHRGYIFETAQVGGPGYTIYDLVDHKVYTIEGDDCTTKDMIEPGLFDRCVEEDDLQKSNAWLGGEDQIIEVDLFKYKNGRFNIFKAMKWSEDGCFPVTTQVRVGRVSVTTMFYDLSAEVSMPNLFSGVEKCGVEVRGEDVEEEEGDEEEEEEDSDSSGE